MDTEFWCVPDPYMIDTHGTIAMQLMELYWFISIFIVHIIQHSQFLFVWYHSVKCIHEINGYHKENHVFITATAIKLNLQKTNFIDKIISNQIALSLIIFLHSKKGAGRFTHLLLMLHIWVSKMGQHWFRYWLVACLAPSHYLNRCWLIVNWTHENKFQWKSNQNSIIFIKKNAF